MNYEIFEGMDFQQYLDLPAINASGLKLIAQSPLKYAHEQKNPRAPSAAMLKGTGVHGMVLEPAEWKKGVAVWEGKVRRGKEWEAFKEANEGAAILTLAEYDEIMAIAESVIAHEEAMKILKGKHEIVITWTDIKTGMKCKCRADSVGQGWCADLKTTKDASPGPDGFGKQCANFQYLLQAAFYHDAVKRAFEWPECQFVFVAVENVPPYAVACYSVTQEQLDIGRMQYRDALEAYARYERSEWPTTSYAEKVMELELPYWAMP